MLLFVVGFLLGLCSLAVLRLVIDLHAASSERRASRFDAAVEAEMNRRYEEQADRYAQWKREDEACDAIKYGSGHVHMVDNDDPFKSV